MTSAKMVNTHPTLHLAPILFACLVVWYKEPELVKCLSQLVEIIPWWKHFFLGHFLYYLHWHLLIFPVELFCIYLLVDFSVKPKLLQGRYVSISNVKTLPLTWLLSYSINLPPTKDDAYLSHPCLYSWRDIRVYHWRARRNGFLEKRMKDNRT